MGAKDRDLELDLLRLAPALRGDDTFADELYCALCNSTWVHDEGGGWCGSWRYSAELVARLRGKGEGYLDFYCSPSGAEGTISRCVSVALAALGWRGTGHGRELRRFDLRAGTVEVWRDGAWVEE